MLNPNNQVISSLIKEYSSGYVTGIYGNAGSGKTTTCMLAAIETAKNSKVIFIDTEKGFNLDRFNQLKNSDTSLLENIFLLQPKNFYQQHEQILKLHDLCKNQKIKLVIVDTISNLYRISLSDNPKKINSLMALQIQSLIRIARDLEKVVLITNQVQQDFKTNEIKLIGGKLISNMCRCIIELNKTENAKYATLIKFPQDVGKKVKYDIFGNGLFLK